MVTVKELKYLCKEAGIKGCYKLKKRELEALLASRKVLYDRRMDNINFVHGDTREDAYYVLYDEDAICDVPNEVWNSIALQDAGAKLYLVTPSIDIKGNIVDVLTSMDIKSTIGELFDKYNQSTMESRGVLGLTPKGPEERPSASWRTSDGVSFTKCEFDKSGICVAFNYINF